MLSFSDRIKMVWRKWFKKNVRITNSEELQELINKENMKLQDLKVTRGDLRAEHNLHQRDLERLQDSQGKLMKKAKSYKDAMDKATLAGDEKAAERAYEGIKEGKRLVDETNMKIKAKESCSEVFSKYVNAADRAVNLQQRKVDDLNVKLSELKIKEQITQSFSKFSNIDFDLSNDATIEQLAHDIEIDYNKVESQLDDLEHKLGTKDDIESYIADNNDITFDTSLDEFIEKLGKDDEEDRGEKLW